jgi:hypothetical protein
MGIASSQYRLLSFLRLNNGKPFLPDVKYEKAVERANERRAEVERALAEVGDLGFLRREFLEIPPQIQGIETRSLADTRSEAFGQMVRLKWQLAADELLLLERVVDAIIAIKRSKTPDSIDHSNEGLLVKVEFLGKSIRERDLFPWKITIETDKPWFYEETLRPLKDWLGIRVDLAPAHEIKLFGQCQIPPAMEGVVGGIVAGQREYGVTCSHVISPNCGSLELKGDPSAGGEQPDAALIHSVTSCFDIEKKRRNKRAVRVAPNALIESCMINRTKVTTLNPGSHSNGFILARVGCFAVSGVLYRFPHMQILSKRLILGFITVPFLYKYFSKPGDSGSWAGETDTESWIGMVVGGSVNPPLSYIAEAAPLLEYFELCLRNQNNKNTRLTPYKFL